MDHERWIEHDTGSSSDWPVQFCLSLCISYDLVRVLPAVLQGGRTWGPGSSSGAMLPSED